eukprot:9477537-Pyramimonas_sp.AAC.1
MAVRRRLRRAFSRTPVRREVLGDAQIPAWLRQGNLVGRTAQLTNASGVAGVGPALWPGVTKSHR